MSNFYNNFWKKQKRETMFDFPYKWPVIKKLIPNQKGLTILDYGCGHGMLLEEMMKINPHSTYIGLDISSQALKLAKKKHPKIKFHVVSDGKKLPIKSHSIDFLLATDVIEHAFYTEKLVSEFNRVLKPSGKILISTPYHGVIKNVIISIVGFEKVFNPVEAHIRFFTKKSLFSLLENFRLKINKYGYFGRFYPVSRGFYVLAEKMNLPTT